MSRIFAPQIDVIAHRGASGAAPENTMAAFRLAHDQGADWFELDCQLTADGEVIVMHDSKLDRTTNGTGLVGVHTLAELRRLDAGSWFAPQFAGEPIPTLAEALDFAHGRRGVYIEIKAAAGEAETALERRILERFAATPTLDAAGLAEVAALAESAGSANVALTRRTLALVRARSMEREVVIQSFSPVVCALARHASESERAPALRVALLASNDKNNPSHWPTRLRWAELLAVEGFNPHLDAVDAALVAHCHGAGRTITVWTVDDPARIRALVGLGVDGIITNHPGRCRSILSEVPRNAP